MCISELFSGFGERNHSRRFRVGRFHFQPDPDGLPQPQQLRVGRRPILQGREDPPESSIGLSLDRIHLWNYSGKDQRLHR